MTDIVWAEPPDINKPRGTGKTQRFVEELKKRPGEWAIYSTSNLGNTTNYRKSYPGTEWMVRRGIVYARWVGQDSEGFELGGQGDWSPR